MYSINYQTSQQWVPQTISQSKIQMATASIRYQEMVKVKLPSLWTNSMKQWQETPLTRKTPSFFCCCPAHCLPNGSGKHSRIELSLSRDRSDWTCFVEECRAVALLPSSSRKLAWCRWRFPWARVALLLSALHQALSGPSQSSFFSTHPPCNTIRGCRVLLVAFVSPTSLDRDLSRTMQRAEHRPKRSR